MEIFLLLVRVALAGVFGLAGIAKALDPEGSEKAFGDFGLPKPVAKILLYVLPAVELAIAGALLFTTVSWYAAIAGLVLLLTFIGGMLYQLANGKSPDCHCFGQLHSEPVGVSSIVRNIILLMPAGILAVQGPGAQGLSLVSSNQDIKGVLLGIAVVAMLMIAIVFLKKIADEQRQIVRRIEIMELVGREGGPVERENVTHPREGLPLGAVVPDFSLSDLDGNVVSVADLKAEGKPVLFIFVNPGCTPCRALTPDFDRWQTELADKVRFIFITSGDADENRAKFAGSVKKQMLLEGRSEGQRIFRVKWTPMAVLMDKKGRVASFTALGDIGIRELLDKIEKSDPSDDYAFFTSREDRPPTPIRIGEDIPEFTAKDINGNTIDRSYFHGKPTLVTFWSKGCSHCGPMMDEIKAWEAATNGDGPRLLILADGEKEEHLELGLRSPMIIDKNMDIGISLGQFGTPSAILIDEFGKVISETTIGAEDTWALVGKKK